MGKALYRKYRPTKLEDVIGQEQVIKPLASSIKTGNVSHAYLFTGPRGCGKTSVARIFAHEVNNFHYEIEDKYTDIIEIDAASNTGVDNIRELIEKTIIAPAEGKYKVYIIDEVHMLSKSAFNALLKTLEEPPKHVIFIMATTDAYKVPITITSRSQVFNFQLATPDIMLGHLQKIAKAEKIQITDEALNIIVGRGGGSFRDSISLLDQVSTIQSGKVITDADVRSVLGVPEEEDIASLLDAYKSKDFAKITDILQTLLNNGEKPELLAENIIKKIVSQPESALMPLLAKLPEVKDSFPEAKLLLAFLSNINDGKKQNATIAVPKNTIKPKSTPTPVAEVETKIEPTSPEQAKTSADFSWEDFVEKVHKDAPSVSLILKKCQYNYADNMLSIYPNRKIEQSILQSKNTESIIKKHLPDGTRVEISLNPKSIIKDESVSKISDIMGDIEEVKSDGVPFK